MMRHLHMPVLHRSAWITHSVLAEPDFPKPNVVECLVMWLLGAVQDKHIFWAGAARHAEARLAPLAVGLQRSSG